MNKKKTYYRLDFKLESALSIGAADSVETDHDVVRDSRGLPLIPATSLAGVYRSFFNAEQAAKYFGKRLEGGRGDLDESVVRIYDATWLDGNKAVSVRDSVSLKNKVAIPGLKFDRQIVEQGALFRTYVDISNCELCPPEAIENMFVAIDAGMLTFGAKSTRGLGRVSVVSCLRRDFDVEDANSRAAWIDFEMFDDAAWGDEAVVDLTESMQERSACADAPVVFIHLELQQRGALSVREYSTEPNRPDFGQLYVRGIQDEGKDCPVIPGTTWAGAFRDRYRVFSDDEATRSLFGFVGKSNEPGAAETETQKSRISFSESTVHGGEWKEITRNSIDRFTGGTKDGALFTMRTYYSGSTGLDIHIDVRQHEWPSDAIAPLVATLADLHNGFISIGGLAAVGHGLFGITNASLIVGGRECPGFYEKLITAGFEGVTQPDVGGLSEEIGALIGSLQEGDSNE